MHTGCMDPNGAKFTLSAVGCSGRAFGWSTAFCGAEVDFDEDYITDIGISESSLTFPRTLVEETEINGRTTLPVTCNSGGDCQKKCKLFERSSRDGGLPAPQACALCSPPCPDNAGTSLVATVHAFADDVASALELAKICLNPTACVCQVFMMERCSRLKLVGIDPP